MFELFSAFMYGIGCVSVAALASLVNTGVLQVGASSLFSVYSFFQDRIFTATMYYLSRYLLPENCISGMYCRL